MTGSSTSSNILFAALQHDAARGGPLADTGGGAQMWAAAFGNMTSVLNIAAGQRRGSGSRRGRATYCAGCWCIRRSCWPWWGWLVSL